MEALGMIEVYGYLTAVEALDSALKAANVSLVDVVKVRGGLVSVLVTGDVGAVKAAIDASAAAAERVGKIVSIHVIPRPAADVAKMLKRPSTGDQPTPPEPSGGPEPEPEVIEPEPEETQESGQVQKPVIDGTPVITSIESAADSEESSKEASIPEAAEEAVETVPVTVEVPAVTEADSKPVNQPTTSAKPKKVYDPSKVTLLEMRKMTVSKLRSLARDLKIDTMNRQEIRFAKKQELIHGILKYLGQEN